MTPINFLREIYHSDAGGTLVISQILKFDNWLIQTAKIRQNAKNYIFALNACCAKKPS